MGNFRRYDKLGVSCKLLLNTQVQYKTTAASVACFLVYFFIGSNVTDRLVDDGAHHQPGRYHLAFTFEDNG